MKITAIILLSACITASANGNAQSITLSEKNAPLEKVFNEISKQSGYEFLYTTKMMESAKTVDIAVKNASLADVLTICFKGQPFTYTIIEKTVVIKPKDPSTIAQDDNLPPPPIDVKGRVVNENGEPVAGASVQVKGDKTKGTTTDANGNFELKGVDENATLIITGTNIEDYQVKLNGKTDLGVITAKIQEVVGEEVMINTGIQKFKPNEFVGSVVQVDNESLNRNASTDILSRLQGVASGLLFKSGTLNPNSTDQRDNIVIRGYSTILSDKRPLIILDNFPFDGDINSINPNDIETITILKDAVAASIWGPRSGNGVIVITSKKGKLNQPMKVSVSSNISFREAPDYFYAPTLSSSDYVDVETFLFDKGFYTSSINSNLKLALTPAVEILLKRKNGLISPMDSATRLDALRRLDVRNDLANYFYQKPFNQQYAASFSGGSSNHLYRLAIGYDRNMNSASDYSRLSLNSTNQFMMLNQRLQINTGIWCTQTTTKGYSSEANFSYPYAQLVDTNGDPLPIYLRRMGYIDTVGGGKLFDWKYYPLQERDYADNKATGFNYRINASIKYKILKDLDAELSYLTEKFNLEIRNHYGLQTYFARDLINQYTNLSQSSSSLRNPIPVGDILDLDNRIFKHQSLRGQLNYRIKWTDHAFSAMVGGEISDGSSKGNTYRYYGYDEEFGTTIPVDYVNSYPTLPQGNSKIPSKQNISNSYNRTVFAYSNLSYAYRDKYFLYFSARKDGANIFGATTNNKWKPLWSIGGGWEITKEPFYQVMWLPKLKLRLTYGYQGNVNNDISALLTIRYGSANTWNLPSAQIVNPPQADLRWEKVRQLNIGLDYGTTSNRISGSIDYYLKKGIDLIGDKIVPPSTGFSTAKVNYANILGHGLDVQIESQNLVKKLKWSTILLFSYSKDKVTDYKVPIASIKNYVVGSSLPNPIVGRPVSALYSYRWAGLDPLNGDPMGYLNHSVSKNYTSITNSTDLEDMIYNGPSTAPFFGSLRNSFTFKGVSLTFNIIYKLGYYFRRPSIDYNSLFSGLDRGHTDYLLRWQQPGDESHTNVPSLVYPANSGANSNRDLFYTYSEILIEKADHIRFQDLNIGYQITKQQVKKLPANLIKFYLNISNLGILWRANKFKIDQDHVAVPIPALGRLDDLDR
ncbi:MAG TPA: SusC/RagA family TonB-linked outer membrane protein, partial [Chitinophagaceae bacterium]|nr:SusC/RagA family TonB-linked outer membrane protein [Chitinophagaceae bacterium]